MLVIAGPGTGKTATIVNRVVHLVADKGVDPSEIMVATYTEKAARELVSRIATAFAKLDAPTNLDQMRVGTFHALCLQILREYSRSPEMKNLSVIDSFDECFRIMTEWPGFGQLEQAKLPLSPWGGASFGYNLAKNVAAAVCTATEERADLATLAPRIPDEQMREAAGYIADCMRTFAGSSALTFADIQARTLDLFDSCPDVLKDLQDKLRYIIVDEYQDANSIQEKLVLKLAGSRQNVCVVGDDDQSLYRFRGADVQNILRFASRFDACDDSNKLEVNYRSQMGIIDFYNRWMHETHYTGSGGRLSGFDWMGARLDKTVVPSSKRDSEQANPVSVVSCTGAGEDDWHAKILALLRSLQERPGFDLNQVVFICRSTRNAKIQSLIEYLGRAGIGVYASRAGLFAARKEVRLALGCLIKCFSGANHAPQVEVPGGWNPKGKAAKYVDWCFNCQTTANDEALAHPDLSGWLAATSAQFAQGADMRGDHVLLTLFARMMACEPFRTWVAADGRVDLAHTMPARNLAHLAAMLDHYEALQAENDRTGWGNSADWLFKGFLERYFRNLKDSSDLTEAEDDEEYAPSGCVSFITTHQSKGLEYPIVIACSLFEEPDAYRESLSDAIRTAASPGGEVFEQPELTPFYDFWRLYYTAFSRAQDLLVLTSTGTEGDPSPCFKSAYDALPDVSALDVRALHLHSVKPSRVMRTYAFTSDVAAYERCPRLYRLQKELGFPSASTQSEQFGTLVHQSVEEVHRRVMENGSYVPTAEDVMEIVSITRAALEAGGATILKADIGKANRQVMRYLSGNERLWRNVQAAEVELSVPRIVEGSERGGYILKGQVDLVVGQGNAVEILDFKSGKMPKPESMLMRKYRKQLNVYAYLLEQKGYTVDRASLYFTGAGDGENPLHGFKVSSAGVDAVIDEFDAVAHSIEACDYADGAKDAADCKGCMFAAWCGK